MPRSTITSKFQTTVPKPVREKLRLGPGDVLQWEIVGASVRLTGADRAFLKRRGTIHVGRGSSVEDVRRARTQRGTNRG